MTKSNNKTAAIIIIGDEILSGRTLDTNTQYIAKALGQAGIDLVETKTIKDDKKKIIDSIHEFSPKYDYVFTSGGIGPTHDDITSESIAAAFNVAYERNEEAYEILVNLYKAVNQEMNPAREKMAFMPRGVELITYNPPGAPGFKIKNVYVMAGVPYILHAMMTSIIPTLESGKIVKSMNLDIFVGESIIAEDFLSLQKKFPAISMGSYPFKQDGKHGTSLVLRSSDTEQLKNAFEQLNAIAEKYINA